MNPAPTPVSAPPQVICSTTRACALAAADEAARLREAATRLKQERARESEHDV